MHFILISLFSSYSKKCSFAVDKVMIKESYYYCYYSKNYDASN